MWRVFKELWAFLMERKLWWITPIVVMLVLLSFIIVLAGNTGVGAFIYALF